MCESFRTISGLERPPPNPGSRDQEDACKKERKADPATRLFAMDLGLSLNVPAAGATESEDAAAEKSTVKVVFQAEGKEVVGEFEVGQTIAYLKARAMELLQFPPEACRLPSNLSLAINDKVLIDPMSLADYPDFLPGSTVVVVASDQRS